VSLCQETAPLITRAPESSDTTRFDEQNANALNGAANVLASRDFRLLYRYRSGAGGSQNETRDRRA
jgi:hypothetical protein